MSHVLTQVKNEARNACLSTEMFHIVIKGGKTKQKLNLDSSEAVEYTLGNSQGITFRLSTL